MERFTEIHSSVAALKKSRPTKLTSAQRAAVFRSLGHCISMLKVPRKEDVELAASKEAVLADVPWRKIKDLVYARISKIRQESK